MTAVTVHDDFGAEENKISHYFHFLGKPKFLNFPRPTESETVGTVALIPVFHNSPGDGDGHQKGCSQAAVSGCCPEGHMNLTWSSVAVDDEDDLRRWRPAQDTRHTQVLSSQHLVHGSMISLNLSSDTSLGFPETPICELRFLP